MECSSTHTAAHGLQAALDAIEQFTGAYGSGDDAYAWLESIDELADMFDWSTDICLKAARFRLGGPAKQWIGGVPRARIADWDAFKNAFLDKFGEKRDAMLARLSYCVQQDNEAVREYADRFRGLARRAGRSEDAALTHQFIKGLRPFLRKQAMLQRLNDLEQVIDYVNYLDEWDQQENMGMFSTFADGPLRYDYAPQWQGRPLSPHKMRVPAPNYVPYREPHRPVFNHAAGGYVPPTSYTERNSFEAATGYRTKGFCGEKDLAPGPLDRNGRDSRTFPIGPPREPEQLRTAPPIAAPKTPENDQTDLDDLTKELARMKLMYVRDTGLRPPGPPACRLCQNIGHVASNCPYHATAHCMEKDDFWRDQQYEDDGSYYDFYAEGKEPMGNTYAAEKTCRGFQLQPKPRKCIAVTEPQHKEKPTEIPRVERQQESRTADTGAAAEVKNENLSRYGHHCPCPPAGPEPPPWEHSRATTVATAAARGEALAVKQFPASNVAKTLALEQIAADCTKKPIALDPRRHRDLSVKEIISAIAKHLREPEQKLTRASRATTRPNGTHILPPTSPIDLTGQDNAAWEPTAAVLESDISDKLQPGTETCAETPALIALDSDSEKEIFDTSSKAASTDIEEETVSDFKKVSVNKHKLAQPYSFAPTQQQRRPVTRFDALRTTAIIGPHVLETIIDSGASQSFMNKDIVTRLGLEHRVKHASSIGFMNADGCTSRSEGLIKGVTLLLGELQITMDLHVTSGDRYDLLLSCNFLVPIGAKMDYDAKVLRYSLGQSTGEIQVNFRGWDRGCYFLAAETNPVHPGEPPPGPLEPNMPQCATYEVNSTSKDAAKEGNQVKMQPEREDDDQCTEHVLRSLGEPYNEQRDQLYAWKGVPDMRLNTMTKLDTKFSTKVGSLLELGGPRTKKIPYYKKIPPKVTHWDEKEPKRVLPASNQSNHWTFRPP